MDTNGQDITKSVAEMEKETIQSHVTGDPEVTSGFAFWNNVKRAGQFVSPWWSPHRDSDLLRFVLENDFLKSSFYKVIGKISAVNYQVLARDPSVKAHVRQAEEFNRKLMEDSNFGAGWNEYLTQTLFSLFTYDNGYFTEVIGDGPKDGPIVGPALGIASLDSQRCRRTRSSEFPVMYTDTDGNRYLLHRSRVIFDSQLPSGKAEMNKVGLSWTSRCINMAQHLLDILVYNQEKLGSRPTRLLLVGQGISGGQIGQAFAAANESMDNAGLSRFSKMVALGSESKTDIDILVKDLASAPDGFDMETSLQLGMFLIALAGGVPPRDLWPAQTVGATKADAMFQHIGGAAGYASIIKSIIWGIGGSPDGKRHSVGKFLPPHLKLVADVIDDEQDARRAEMDKTRAETRTINIAESTVTDVRAEREKMVKNREMDESTFNRLELEDGRLPNGDDVLKLFLIGDANFQRLLSLPFGDVTDVKANAENAEAVIAAIDEAVIQAKTEGANASLPGQQLRAKQAVAALEALRKLYAEVIGEGDEDEPEPEEAPPDNEGMDADEEVSDEEG
jgi:hypothetical protein